MVKRLTGNKLTPVSVVLSIERVGGIFIPSVLSFLQYWKIHVMHDDPLHHPNKPKKYGLLLCIEHPIMCSAEPKAHGERIFGTRAKKI